MEKRSRIVGEWSFHSKRIMKDLTQKHCRVIVVTYPKPEKTEPMVPLALVCRVSKNGPF